MNAGQIFSIGVTVIGLLVGALGTLQSKRKDLIIDTLTKDNVAKTDYIATLESEKTRLSAQNNSLQSANKDLKDLAQGSPQLKVLSDEVSKLTAAILKHLGLARSKK